MFFTTKYSIIKRFKDVFNITCHSLLLKLCLKYYYVYFYILVIVTARSAESLVVQLHSFSKYIYK